jgi:hypothetical protein
LSVFLFRLKEQQEQQAVEQRIGFHHSRRDCGSTSRAANHSPFRNASTDPFRSHCRRSAFSNPCRFHFGHARRLIRQRAIGDLLPGFAARHCATGDHAADRTDCGTVRHRAEIVLP